MQTFKQFLEAREVRDIPHNDTYQILRHIDDPILCVRFALYCAEDCFHLNNERTRSAAQRCIDLVRKWLRDPKSVKKQELRSVADVVYITADDADAAAADWSSVGIAANAASAASAAYAVAWTAYAAGAVDTAGWSASYATDAVSYAVNAAAYEYHQHDTLEWRQIRNQKLQEYIRKLKGMTTTRTGPKTSIEPLKGYDNDYVTIMAALDSLEEIGEIGKEHFVYQDDDGQWVFDLGHDNVLRAADKETLAKDINKDRYYLNALMRIYNANV